MISSTSIPEAELGRMFELAGVDQQRFYAALLSMGPRYLSNDGLRLWSEHRPTIGYEYVIVDWLRYWHTPNAVLHHLYVQDHVHRFLRDMSDQVIDLCAREFDDYGSIDYSQSFARRFYTPMPSQRARMLAATYGDPERPTYG